MPKLRLLTVLAAESISDDGVQWIELMPVGEKLRNGPWYFTITADDLETYAASIRAKGDQTPIDYDHSYAEGKGTRAAGWFTGNAEVREGPRLWAEVQWTPAAVEAIKNREYRFVSPEFSFQEKDSKTGLMTKAKEILANTLTNRPFFDELAALAAAGDLVWRPNEGYAFLQQQVYAALNPGGYESARYWVSDIASGKALVEEYKTAQTWVVPFAVVGDAVEIAASSDWVEAKREWVAAANEAAAEMSKGRRPATEGEHMDPKEIRAALGLAESATDDEVSAALTAQAAKAQRADELETEVDTLKAQQEDGGSDEVATLRTDLAAERTKRVVGEREIVLADAVRKGQIVPAAKESLATQFGGDAPTDEHLDGLKAVIASFPERSFTERGSGDGPVDKPDVARATKDLAGDDAEKVDEGEAAAHTRALAILAEQGKTEYTADEYVKAYEKAESELAVTG